jgi:hypothetical protein
MPVQIVDAPPAPDGSPRWMWRATAGQGHKVGWATSIEEADRRGNRALRHLHAVETHTPEELAMMEAGDGEVVLRAPDGTVVSVDERVAAPLLAAGYTEAVGEIPQRTNERPGPVEVHESPKRRGRTPAVVPQDEL